MTIREYLESKPDNFRFEILYQFDNWCPECRKHVIDTDDEYSADGTAGDFRQQVEGTCSGFNHYKNYSFVYEDFQTDGDVVQLEESADGVTITIVVDGEPRTCEDCEQNGLDELAADAVEPERRHLLHESLKNIKVLGILPEFDDLVKRISAEKEVITIPKTIEVIKNFLKDAEKDLEEIEKLVDTRKYDLELATDDSAEGLAELAELVRDFAKAAETAEKLEEKVISSRLNFFTKLLSNLFSAILADRASILNGLFGDQMPTAEALNDARENRNYNNLRKWAESLTEPEINALSDFGYYNNAMKGYAIRAAREMELNEDQTRELVRCFSYALDMMDKEEAEKLYIDF